MKTMASEMPMSGGGSGEEHDHVERHGPIAMCKHCGGEVEEDGFAKNMSTGGEVESENMAQLNGDADEQSQQQTATERFRDEAFLSSIRRRGGR